MENTISISHLDFSYSGKKVLDNFSIQVPAHSIFGFLGANGSGKTTTIRLILGLLPYSNGDIQVFGKAITRERIAILNQVGALVEVPSLYLHTSGYNNIEISRKLIGDLPKSRTSEVLEYVGLTGDANRAVRTYSLGMKQRLGIALALLSKPKLLILDEPTNGLDPSGIKDIRELIINLNKSMGTTVLISSHLLSEIEKTATHVGVLNTGHCIFQGPISDLQSMSNKKIFKFKVESIPRALQAIHPLQNVLVIQRDETQNWLYVQVSEISLIPTINQLLVQNNVAVFGIETETASLEAAFMELTEIKK